MCLVTFRKREKSSSKALCKSIAHIVIAIRDERLAHFQEVWSNQCCNLVKALSCIRHRMMRIDFVTSAVVHISICIWPCQAIYHKSCYFKPWSWQENMWLWICLAIFLWTHLHIVQKSICVIRCRTHDRAFILDSLFSIFLSWQSSSSPPFGMQGGLSE